MVAEKHYGRPGPLPEELAETILPALRQLLEAHLLARHADRAVEDFALEARYLIGAGCSISALRWLTCLGYAQHLLKEAAPGAERPSFRPAESLMLTGQSCFVLTEKGSDLAQRALATPHLRPHGSPADKLRRQAATPRWEAETRELWVGGQLVKRFRVPAPNQELILAAFEEQGWPPRIDDPLLRDDFTDPRDRVHEAVKRLNGRQATPLLRFRTDANGTGIRWELVEPAAAASA
jgi:hypothetical protein